LPTVSGFSLSLGPDGALRAVEAAGFTPTGHVAPLTCLENRVYDVRLEDGSHVVVKFYRPGRWSRQAILEEHAFLADLGAAEIPVCAPLAGGTDRTGLTTLREQEGLLYALWPRTGGRSPDELPAAALPILGRLLARIHAVGAAGAAIERPCFDAESRVHEPLATLASFVPPSCARRYAAAAQAVARCYEERSPGGPVHRIHGDCHRGNLLERNGAWFFLDFDDFGVGPAVQDVWMLLPGRDAETLRQRAVLLEAYREFRDFDDAWLELVEPLRAMRFVWYAAWIARRWGDPVFPDAFPHFGTEEYWERETRDLEEQAERIAGGGGGSEAAPGRAEPATEERELTNEDFFWDL
jgi:Ser/Thr protein kinase RdoA (MazF antagonist)